MKTKTLQEALYQNKLKHRQINLAKQRQQRQDTILGYGIAIFIVVIVSMFLIGTYGSKDSMKNCLEKYNDRIYCERVL